MGTTEENERQDILKRVFGMLQDKVRIYQILEEREVQRDEFQYCQIMFQIVFGDKGFADTLGPTWNMIHDPRFVEIENLMVQNRKAIFGGDARLGKQYINDDGSFSSTVSDLEKYAEIVGEGRNFLNVLNHPDEKCQKRLWLERIYRGFSNIKPNYSLGCTCSFVRGLGNDPATFKDRDEHEVWDLIRQECPNRAFDQGGYPNAYGRLMFTLIRADLIGLIRDYAETPLIDSYVYLRDNGVVEAVEAVATVDPHGQDAPRVLQEIDILEQALTHRANMRVTAYKLLKKVGFEHAIENLYGAVDLTDPERDELLRIIYTSDYPADTDEVEFRYKLHLWEKDIKERLLAYVATVVGKPIAEREQEQLIALSANSQNTVEGLLKGTVQPINSYTEPTSEIPEGKDEGEVMKYAAMMQAIMANEFKQELYLVLVEAEAQGNTAVIDILTPIFHTPEYPLDEKGFYNVLESIRIGSRSLRAERLDAIRGTKQSGLGLDPKKDLKHVEGEFHSKDNPGGMYRS
jgi:hypothetical protein